MLVIARKEGERFFIGENIEVLIVRISPTSVRIGIEAPRDMSIVRDDVAWRPPAAEASAGTAEDYE